MFVDVESSAGRRRVDLAAVLGPQDQERVHEDAYAWIKAVRHLRVDGLPFRSRFTFRGDSLWWFAELYLHKGQAINAAIRALRAVERLVELDRPQAIACADRRYGPVVARAAAARGIRYEGPTWRTGSSLIALDARAMRLAAAAHVSRLRPGSVPRDTAPLSAFVHRAFWQAGGSDGSAESYIGPVLRELERRLATDGVRYVGVGPRTNFRARRWWNPLAGGGRGVTPIERYAPLTAMRASRDLYARRHEIRRAMWASADLRAHAVIRGVDCWPLVREQLAGIALLQFPWSVRAMDEAAAALAAIAPEVAVTYAEAGGWGRALALEARRLGIPLAGLQHGFIYRHWLNYRHEPDEMLADVGNASDAGFPLPAKTLVFDDFAAAHLRGPGHFPPEAVAITGSARLDEVVAAVEALKPADRDAVRHSAGASEQQALLVFAAKEREARASLPALVAAVRDLPAVQLAIKPHPAETAAVYAHATAGVPNIRVLPADAPLPPLLGAARGLVTVNSTVAIDALALGVPSLVIGLPNNLTPFVDRGTMLGAASAAEIHEGLTRLLYDQEFRSRIESQRTVRRSSAAAAAAETILALRQ